MSTGSFYGHCKIAGDGCKAPSAIRNAAGIGEMPRERVGHCARCGETVCTNKHCSRRRRDGRLCIDCIEDN